jgi:predicted O-methyltransferase YrrM
VSTPRTHPKDPGEPQHGFPRVAVDAEEEAFLSLLARGRRILEIGTGLGYSTRALYKGFQHCGRFITVDKDPWVLQEVWPILAQDFTPGSVVFMPGWPPVGLDYFELVFVDGDHSASAVAQDFREALKRCAGPGSVLAFHDWGHIPDTVCSTVTALVEDLAPIYSVRTVYGIGVIVVTQTLMERYA